MNDCLFIAENMIAQGNTAEIYKLGDGRILKLFRDGIARSAIEQEYNNSRIAVRYLTHVPQVYELTAHNGRSGILFQEVSGTELTQLLLTNPIKLRKYMTDFARYHSEITKPIADEMRMVRDKLSDEISWGNDLSEYEKKEVVEYLSRLPDGDCLCHCDFHPGNVMISDNDVFFLDWMTACKGDSCADAARTYLLLRYGEPMHISRLKLLMIRSSMVRNCRIYLREYCRLTGVQKEQIMKWVLPVAAARLSEWLTDNERRKLIRLVRRGIAKGTI